VSLASLIKKHIYGKPHEVLVFHPRGFEKECAGELAAILSTLSSSSQFEPQLDLTDAGIRISNLHFRSLLEITLRSRTARDVLWILGQARAASVKEIRAQLHKIRWPLIIDESAHIGLKVSCTDSRFRHEGLLEEIITAELLSHDFIVEKRNDAGDLVDVRLEKNRLQTALSMSGGTLFQRRYKTLLRGEASIKEDLAACLIRSTFAWLQEPGRSYAPDHVLCPFAGSGTLGYETFFAALSVPASLFRDDLAVLRLKPSRSPALRYIENELYKRSRTINGPGITFIDDSEEACEELSKTSAAITRKLKDHLIRFDAEIIQEDAFELHAPAPSDCEVFLPLNPPYGHRLKIKGAPSKLYRRLGEALVRWSGSGSTLSGFVLAPDKETEHAFCKSVRDFRLDSRECIHGGKRIRFIRFASVGSQRL